MITEVLVSEYMRTMGGAEQAMTTDPVFNMQFHWMRLVLLRLEEVLRVEGCDPWRSERVMRGVLGTMEDPALALARVVERSYAARKAMLN